MTKKRTLPACAFEMAPEDYQIARAHLYASADLADAMAKTQRGSLPRARGGSSFLGLASSGTGASTPEVANMWRDGNLPKRLIRVISRRRHTPDDIRKNALDFLLCYEKNDAQRIKDAAWRIFFAERRPGQA